MELKTAEILRQQAFRLFKVYVDYILPPTLLQATTIEENEEMEREYDEVSEEAEELKVVEYEPD